MTSRRRQRTARLAVASALAALTLASGCDGPPSDDASYPTPVGTYSTVPPPQDSPTPPPVGDALVMETLWTGAKELSSVRAIVAEDLAVITGGGPGDATQLLVVDTRRGALLWSSDQVALDLGRNAVLATDRRELRVHLARRGASRIVLVPFGIEGCFPHTSCRVRFTSAAGLAAIDARRHTVLWTRVLQTSDGERPISDAGAGVIGVDGETVVVDLAQSGPDLVRTGNEVVALDLGSGAVRWRARGHSVGYVAGGAVVTTSLVKEEKDATATWADVSGLVALEAATGNRLWGTPIPDLGKIAFLSGNERFAVAVARNDADLSRDGRGYLVDARTGTIVRRLGDGNDGCRAGGGEVACLNLISDGVKVIDLEDGSQSLVPVPSTAVQLWAGDGARFYLAGRDDSLVIDRSGAIVSDEVPAAAVLAARGDVLVLAAALEDPLEQADEGPVSVVRVSSRGS